jgi:hypothetical protein
MDTDTEADRRSIADVARVDGAEHLARASTAFAASRRSSIGAPKMASLDQASW